MSACLPQHRAGDAWPVRLTLSTLVQQARTQVHKHGAGWFDFTKWNLTIDFSESCLFRFIYHEKIISR